MTKNIDLREARKLSKNFCKDFELPPCEIYFVDKLKDYWGIYIWLMPNHILVRKKNPCMIGIIMHELTHHLEWHGYPIGIADPHHGKYFQLAKRKVINWCIKNISNKPNWKIPLGARPNDEELKKFRL